MKMGENKKKIGKFDKTEHAHGEKQTAAPFQECCSSRARSVSPAPLGRCGSHWTRTRMQDDPAGLGDGVGVLAGGIGALARGGQGSSSQASLRGLFCI